MTATPGTLEQLLGGLSKILSPLSAELSPQQAQRFFAELGIPLTAAQANQLATAFETLRTGLQQVLEVGGRLEEAIAAEDYAAMTQRVVEGISQLATLVSSFGALTPALGSISLPPSVTPADIAAVPERLFDYLIVRYLSHYVGVVELLEFTGVLERVDHNVGSADPTLPFYTTNAWHFDRLGGWVSTPGEQLRTSFGWGDPAFDGLALFTLLDRVLAQLGAPVLFTSMPTPTLDLLFLEIKPARDVSPPGLALGLRESLQSGSLELSSGDWTLTGTAEFPALSGTQIVLQPNGQVTIRPPEAASLTGKVRVSYTAHHADSTPIVLLGQAGASRLEIEEGSAFGEVQFAWHSDHAEGTVGLGGALTSGKAIIDAGEGDGFLQKILDGARIENTFSLAFSFSSNEGLHFEGSGTLEIQLASHISLGPVDVTALTLSVGIDGNRFPLAVTTDIKARLGPLVAVVEAIGIQGTLTLRGARDGNLGPVDFGLGFKPPRGAGLSIDVGVIVGGGYVFFDPDRGEYAGVLELAIAGVVTVKAIGLISTRMPDGTPGFSLLIILTAEFGAGIQLGFGFTLNAVGGLLGLNRTMLFDLLMQGVRTGAVDNIMFPRDVVANAPRIISDLRAIFPPHEGTFLIGPMAKLGWGEPTLVSLSLGVIIVIPPGDIAILGVLQLALPTVDADILRLQVSFAGALEFSKQRLYFFASLYDSHLLFITIQGEMGLLFAYGQDANFVVSVGGFHPRFNPPPLPFPTPQRIQLNIVNESYARIRADGYFAVTSNTAQFGSHADMFFGFSALSVEGHSGFDALIQFSPFHFVVEISTSFSVKVFGVGVWGLGIDLTLEGPTPWHAHGTASISFFFFSIDVNVDFTWGDPRDTMLPPVAVMPIVLGELGKRSNWKAQLPSGSNLLVSLRHLDPGEADLVLHPVGSLQVSQRAVPLDLHLDKVGNQRPSDANQFALAVSSTGLLKTRDLTEPFAPAQFRDFDDAAKLSQPAYAPLGSGIEVAPAGKAADSGAALTRIVRYDLHIVDTKLQPPRRHRFFVYPGALFQHWLGGASVAFSELSAARGKLTKAYPDAVTVSPETYAVANLADNTLVHSEAASFVSRAAASDYIVRTVAADPARAGMLHVLPTFEVAS